MTAWGYSTHPPLRVERSATQGRSDIIERWEQRASPLFSFFYVRGSHHQGFGFLTNTVRCEKGAQRLWTTGAALGHLINTRRTSSESLASIPPQRRAMQAHWGRNMRPYVHEQKLLTATLTTPNAGRASRLKREKLRSLSPSQFQMCNVYTRTHFLINEIRTWRKDQRWFCIGRGGLRPGWIISHVFVRGFCLFFTDCETRSKLRWPTAVAAFCVCICTPSWAPPRLLWHQRCTHSIGARRSGFLRGFGAKPWYDSRSHRWKPAVSSCEPPGTAGRLHPRGTAPRKSLNNKELSARQAGGVRVQTADPFHVDV